MLTTIASPRQPIYTLMNYYPVKELSCGEAGFDCNYIAKGETEEVTKKGSRADHDGPWDLT